MDFSELLPLLKPNTDSTTNSGDGFVSDSCGDAVDKAGVEVERDFWNVSEPVKSAEGFSPSADVIVVGSEVKLEVVGSEDEYSPLLLPLAAEPDDEMVFTDINDDDNADERGRESIDTLSMSLIFFEHTLSTSSSCL